MKIQTIVAIVLLVVISPNCKKKIIDVLPQLEIEVVNIDGISQTGVSVKIFTTIEDWQEDKNIIQYSITDSKGTVLFQELEECVYYFLAEKGDLNNRFNISVTEKKLAINVIAIIKTTIE